MCWSCRDSKIACGREVQLIVDVNDFKHHKKHAAEDELPVLFHPTAPIRFLVKLQEFNYQLKVKAVFDK